MMTNGTLVTNENSGGSRKNNFQIKYKKRGN